MPYYIVACNKEGHNEEQIHKLINDQVLVDQRRVIGQCFPLFGDRVSSNNFYYLTLFINRSGKQSSRLDLLTN